MSTTQNELDTFLMAIQCKIGSKANSISNKLEIGTYCIDDIIKFIFSVIYFKILLKFDINETCLTEEQVCSIAMFLKKYYKNCAC